MLLDRQDRQDKTSDTTTEDQDQDRGQYIKVKKKNTRKIKTKIMTMTINMTMTKARQNKTRQNGTREDEIVEKGEQKTNAEDIRVRFRFRVRVRVRVRLGLRLGLGLTQTKALMTLIIKNLSFSRCAFLMMNSARASAEDMRLANKCKVTPPPLDQSEMRHQGPIRKKK